MITIILLAIVAIMILLLVWDSIQKPKEGETTPVNADSGSKAQPGQEQAPSISQDSGKPAL